MNALCLQAVLTLLFIIVGGRFQIVDKLRHRLVVGLLLFDGSPSLSLAPGDTDCTA